MSVSELQIGDRVLVKPGELVPTDGIVTEGFSAINQASITGESMPVEKTVGDEVFAGTINGNGALKIQIDRLPESSLRASPKSLESWRPNIQINYSKWLWL